MRVEFLRLRHRVEDSKVGLRITPCRCSPLPTAVVCRQVVVIELPREVAFAATPVDTEILGQKAGGHHAQAVVHVSALIELRHRGIDQRVASGACAPGIKHSLGVWTGLPLNPIVFGSVGVVDDMRVMPQDHVIKVAPDQLG